MIRKTVLICALLSISLASAENVERDIKKREVLEFHQASLNYQLGLPDEFHACIHKAQVSLAKQSQCLIDEEINQSTRLETAYQALSSLLPQKRKLELKLAHERWIQDTPNQCAVLRGFIGSDQDKQNRIIDCVIYEYAKRSVDYERYVFFRDALIFYGKHDENAQPTSRGALSEPPRP